MKLKRSTLLIVGGAALAAFLFWRKRGGGTATAPTKPSPRTGPIVTGPTGLSYSEDDGGPA